MTDKQQKLKYTLPKFSIKPKTKKEAEIISNWFDNNWVHGGKIYLSRINSYDEYYRFGVKPSDVYYSKPNEDYPEIDFKEFLRITNQTIPVSLIVW